MNKIKELFDDTKLVQRIQDRLPYLFQLAELDSTRGGRIGMEVGSIRERIIVALLIHKFGQQYVKTEFPITEPEIDVAIENEAYSIKTITNKKLGGGVKLIWTVDTQKAHQFRNNYQPSCGMILIHINWTNGGGFYYFSQTVQQEVLQEIGRESYIKLPKIGTNPRGVEMTSLALQTLGQHEKKLFIPINWAKTNIDYNPFKKWVEHWQEK